MSLKMHKLLKATPAVTGECTPCSCRNAKKTLKHPPSLRDEARFPALSAEQCLVPNHKGKEP